MGCPSSWRGRISTTAGLVALVLVAGVLGAGPTFAATASLTVNKLVDGQDAVSVSPGDEFTYTVAVGCDDNDCTDARLTDNLPAEFAGFTILSTSVAPTGQPSNAAYAGCAGTVTASCVLTVSFLQDLGGGVVGIRAGDTYNVSVNLKSPLDLAPTWPSNGDAVRNTATATSATADPQEDSADVTVNIPIVVDTAVGKTWTPASQQFQPGVGSTITLTSRNTSNVAAATLVAQDPASATDADSTLGADNPFALVDFTGFGAVTLPDGASTVQVDAYVFDSASGTYSWQPGQPRAPGAIDLPAGVSAGEVAGLRFTYQGPSGATLTPDGTAGSVAMQVEQRATNRNTGASLVGGATVTNKVTGTVTAPGQTPVSKSATAPYSIGGLTVSVDAGKSITPVRIPAGTTAAATISGKNTSNGPLSSLSLSDLNYFTDTLRFGGFSSAVSYPNGATAATVTWHFSDGSTASAAVSDGATPTAPSAPAGEHLTGFVLTYTGAIAQNATATAQFGIVPTGDFVSVANSPASVPNSLTVDGTNSAGSASDAATAPLQVFFPDIDLGIAKSISPAGSVAPGGTVVAQLPTTTGTDSAFVRPDKIVVQDVWRTGQTNDFWNAFNPIAVAPTQVPDGSTLTIEYSTDAGATWLPLTVVDATGGAQVYSANLPGALIGSITGLRFTFEDAGGFGQGTTVSPNTVFQARPTLRAGGGPTSVADSGPTTYENLGTAQAQGLVDGVPNLTSDLVTDPADAAIETHTGAGTLLASKSWRTTDFANDLNLLSSQSAAQAGTALHWGVTSTGYDSLTITDPSADVADPTQTAFQAFDLKTISARSFAAEPLLRWDTVSTIELFEGGMWTTVAPPAGGWMNATGFVGHTLTAGESAGTTGVRITVVPNDVARAASTDPLAPPVGSGIATSSGNDNREFRLLWQLRNTVRAPSANPSPWVTATHGYNDSDPATIWNSMAVDGAQNGSPVGPLLVRDNISLVDQPPGVQVTKASSKASVVVPHPGDVQPQNYPTNDFTVTAKNTSSSRASYIRVSDPMPCDAGSVGDCLTPASGWGQNPYTAVAYDPLTNPLERLNLTGIGFSTNAGQVSPTASIVTLWERDAAGNLSTTQVTMAQAIALTATDLADVVGVSVLYQGADPAANGGSIASTNLVMTLHTQVRVHLRSDDATFVTPFTIDNHTYAQSYDPVLYPSGAQSTPSDSANAPLALTSGDLGVTASKVISPATLLETNRTDPVTVTLGATQGTATVATNEVTIQDTDPEFWSSFRLTGLAAADVTLPAGADQVRVDVQLNGSTTWTAGTAGPTAALPAVAVDQVTGVRFVFNRADDDLLSHSLVPTAFSAQAVLHVRLLDTVRGGTTPIVFPSSIDDTVQTSSHRYESPTIFPDANAAASDDIALVTGTFGMDVSKTPQGGIHTVSPGDPNTWTMTFANTGSGFLDVNDLVDQLPTSLSWDGVDPTFATSAGGLLSTNVTTAYDAGTRALTFTWPPAAGRMAPGERFTITLGITLEPGLTGTQRATNQFIVDTTETLASCTNTSGNGQGILSGLAGTQCGTSNFVQPTPGPSLVTTKGVKGDVIDHTVAGAVNVNNPNGICVPDGSGYYRSPCAANTVVGGTDEWKLGAVNSGTIPYTTLTLVDPLPFAGDRLLATGASRGSTYRPTFDGDFGMTFTAPAGTTITWQVTTASDVCVGTGSTPAWPTDPTCSTHPVAGQWTNSTAYAGNWADVTGLRVVLNFAGAAGGTLPPGSGVTAIYRTVDTPQSVGHTDLAPTAAPVTNAFAWNQFGAVATLTSGAPIARAPVKAGVTLAGGPLQVVKVVAGPAASFAPTSFQADVSCTVAGATVDLGASSTLSLDAADALTATVAGIPLGADCVVVESGQTGDYGERSRSVTPGTVHISATGGAGTVPGDQVVTITNDYEYGQLSLDKQADSAVVTPGGSTSYTITVTNTGKLVATNVDVTDQLPPQATFVSADGGGTESSGVVTWTIATLTPGDTTALHITLQFPTTGTFTNQASIATPPGPWQPTRFGNPCPVGSSACASVIVKAARDAAGAGSAPSGGGLPFTGSNIWQQLWAAILLLLAGAGLTLVVRRRAAQRGRSAPFG